MMMRRSGIYPNADVMGFSALDTTATTTIPSVTTTTTTTWSPCQSREDFWHCFAIPLRLSLWSNGKEKERDPLTSLATSTTTTSAVYHFNRR